MISEMVRPFGLSLARRRTRRWLVILYWAIVVPLFCTGFALLAFRPKGANSFVVQICLQSVLWILLLLGGGSSGGWVKPFRRQRPLPERTLRLFASPPPTSAQLIAQELALDEREQALRDRVHFYAYSVAQTIVLVLFVFDLMLGMWRQELMRQCGPTLLFFISLMLVSLPQSLILWNEPDAEE